MAIIEAVAARENFNPRTPRGVRQIQFVSDLTASLFQSTHPARGATFANTPLCSLRRQFQSTHPARGATRPDVRGRCYHGHFNPRTPRGVRQRTSTRLSLSRTFQSTHPARGATVSRAAYENTPRRFQSTHPARGATAGLFSAFRGASDFNPRTPRGVRQDRRWQLADMRRISIHAPREGCDSKLYQRAESLLGSICLFAQGEEG